VAEFRMPALARAAKEKRARVARVVQDPQRAGVLEWGPQDVAGVRAVTRPPRKQQLLRARKALSVAMADPVRRNVSKKVRSVPWIC
jgi:hypothetical protein